MPSSRPREKPPNRPRSTTARHGRRLRILRTTRPTSLHGSSSPPRLLPPLLIRVCRKHKQCPTVVHKPQVANAMLLGELPQLGQGFDARIGRTALRKAKHGDVLNPGHVRQRVGVLRVNLVVVEVHARNRFQQRLRRLAVVRLRDKAPAGRFAFAVGGPRGVWGFGRRRRGGAAMGWFAVTSL